MANTIFASLNNAGRTYVLGKISITALESATCTVRPGDRIAVIGPSGSGKSTLLYLMGGLDAPTSGSVSWPELGIKQQLQPEKNRCYLSIGKPLGSIDSCGKC